MSHSPTPFLGAPLTGFSARTSSLEFQKGFQIVPQIMMSLFVIGQRVRWTKLQSHIVAVKWIRRDRERASEEFKEIEVDISLPDTDHCSAALRTQYQSILGNINMLQSRTPHQACDLLSRCASVAARSTSGNPRALSKLVRSVRAEPCVLRDWSWQGILRLVGFRDDDYITNTDNSCQHAQN